MNMAQIHMEALKEDKRRSQVALAVADLRDRIDANSVAAYAEMRRRYASYNFRVECVTYKVADLPMWGLREFIDWGYGDEFDAIIRASRLRSIEAVEKSYGVYLKEERAWYAYLEER